MAPAWRIQYDAWHGYNLQHVYHDIPRGTSTAVRVSALQTLKIYFSTSLANTAVGANEASDQGLQNLLYDEFQT